jgi:hypothetical protein
MANTLGSRENPFPFSLADSSTASDGTLTPSDDESVVFLDLNASPFSHRVKSPAASRSFSTPAGTTRSIHLKPATAASSSSNNTANAGSLVHHPMDELLGVLTTSIVGLSYHSGEAERGESVSLNREPDNRFDRNAIAVHNIADETVGHVSRDVAMDLAPLMDQNLVTFEAEATGSVKKYLQAMDVAIFYPCTATESKEVVLQKLNRISGFGAGRHWKKKRAPRAPKIVEEVKPNPLEVEVGHISTTINYTLPYQKDKAANGETVLIRRAPKEEVKGKKGLIVICNAKGKMIGHLPVGVEKSLIKLLDYKWVRLSAKTDIVARVNRTGLKKTQTVDIKVYCIPKTRKDFEDLMKVLYRVSGFYQSYFLDIDAHFRRLQRLEQSNDKTQNLYFEGLHKNSAGEILIAFNIDLAEINPSVSVESGMQVHLTDEGIVLTKEGDLYVGDVQSHDQELVNAVRKVPHIMIRGVLQCDRMNQVGVTVIIELPTYMLDKKEEILATLNKILEDHNRKENKLAKLVLEFHADSLITVGFFDISITVTEGPELAVPGLEVNLSRVPKVCGMTAKDMGFWGLVSSGDVAAIRNSHWLVRTQCFLTSSVNESKVTASIRVAIPSDSLESFNHVKDGMQSRLSELNKKFYTGFGFSPMLATTKDVASPFSYAVTNAPSLTYETEAIVEMTTVNWEVQQKELDAMFDQVHKDQMAGIPEYPLSSHLHNVTLFDYQLEGIRWLIHQERNQNILPFFTFKPGQGWFCEITKCLMKKKPEPISGRILADDMGLGKVRV